MWADSEDLGAAEVHARHDEEDDNESSSNGEVAGDGEDDEVDNLKRKRVYAWPISPRAVRARLM